MQQKGILRLTHWLSYSRELLSILPTSKLPKTKPGSGQRTNFQSNALLMFSAMLNGTACVSESTPTLKLTPNAKYWAVHRVYTTWSVSFQDCCFCRRRHRCRPQPPMMGVLPYERLAPLKHHSFGWTLIISARSSSLSCAQQQKDGACSSRASPLAQSTWTSHGHTTSFL